MSQQQSYRPILSIFDLLDRVLDKGLVILVVRARIVVAGVDTFLRYAAALGLAGPPALVAAQTSTGK
jgi:hypothetical protein